MWRDGVRDQLDRCGATFKSDDCEHSVVPSTQSVSASYGESKCVRLLKVCVTETHAEQYLRSGDRWQTKCIERARHAVAGIRVW